MKKIIFLIIFIILSFRENINKQILKKLDKIDNEIKIIKKEIDFTKKEMRIGFEAMEKRFEILIHLINSPNNWYFCSYRFYDIG